MSREGVGLPNQKRLNIEQLVRSIWPMPGGAKNYAENLRLMLGYCDPPASVEVIVDRIIHEFPKVKSQRTARGYVDHVLRALGLVEATNRCTVKQTAAGRKFSKTGNRIILRDLLLERVAGIEDIIQILEARPLRVGVIHELLGHRGYTWESDWQVRYRLRWMETTGLVQRRDYDASRRTRQRYVEYVVTTAAESLADAGIASANEA